MSDIFSVSSILSSVFVFLVGFCLIVFVSRYLSVSFGRATFIYVWHTIFCVFYLWYVLENGGDAVGYFRRGTSEPDWAGVGTSGVDFFISVIFYIFPLSIFGVSLFFNLIGCVGLLAFDAALKQATLGGGRNLRIISTIIVLLPSVSFWSSGIGKDAISFMAVCLSIWAALNFPRRMVLFIFAVLCMLLVRPHMAGMLGLGLAVSFIFQRRVSLPQRVVLGGIALAAAIFLVPLGLNYAGISEGAGAEDVMHYIETRQGQNLKGGGGVDISGMSPPLQMFTYLFRPMLIEIRDLFSLAAALDNTILLFLFIAGGWSMLKKKPSAPRLMAHNRVFLWVYSLGSWAILAMTTANLGIALRQKWMFAPMLIFLLISVIGRSRQPAKLDQAALEGTKP